MTAILLVCTANRCRSPLAAATLQRLLAGGDGAGGIRVESAGTWAVAGLPATPEAVEAGRAAGLDLSGHRARSVADLALDSYDLILTMEAGQREALRVEQPRHADRVQLIAEMAGESFDITDPTGRALEEHHACLRELRNALERGLARILALIGHPAPARRA